MAEGSHTVTRVLIVDDDEAIRTTLGDIFRKKGYFIKAVESASAALSEVKNNPFHFAVIDIHLPDMPGTQLLEEIRKINFKINCIMITGDSEESAESSIAKGAAAHLMKPLKLDQLVSIFEHK